MLYVAPSAVADAQAPRDTATCRTMLSAPTPDSAITRISLSVRPFDTVSVRMTPAYREQITTSVRQFFKAPQPIALHVYSSELALASGHGPGFTTLELRTMYRATLHRDGHLTTVHVVGGTTDSAFDAEVLRAIQRVSDSSLLVPAIAPAVIFDGDSVALQFVVKSDDVALPARFKNDGTGHPDGTPLLRLRTPLRQITRQVVARGVNHPPDYPEKMRSTTVGGVSTFIYVINELGQPEMSTVTVDATPSSAFVNAVLDALPSHRFNPLLVEGCAAPVLVSQKFDFHLTP
ncbi:MAG TPA: energy transducer TonB [Gemmatimonadaceae bacterium]|jgi:hypothetical protein